MKAEKIKESIAAQTVPTTYYDIGAAPSEADVPCRTQSALAFIGAGGIFTGVTKNKTSVIIRGVNVEVISFNLALNPSNRIKPGANVPDCTMDGVLFLPAQSVNVKSVADPQYIRDANNRVTNVLLYFMRTNKAQAATLGVRVKFEENVGTTANFNPKKKQGTIAFP
ncbi:MAG: hypothetical protein JSS81_25680 [Acidobacteria bacterium]|nr:hypothetical protein [Acidobacteriota bacterium]